MFDHQRTVVGEDNDTADDLEEISTRNLLLLPPSKTLEPMTTALKSLEILMKKTMGLWRFVLRTNW